MTRRIRRNLAKRECGPGTELRDVWPAYLRGESHDPTRRPKRSWKWIIAGNKGSANWRWLLPRLNMYIGMKFKIRRAKTGQGQMIRLPR